MFLCVFGMCVVFFLSVLVRVLCYFCVYVCFWFCDVFVQFFFSFQFVSVFFRRSASVYLPPSQPFFVGLANREIFSVPAPCSNKSPGCSGES